MGIKFNTFFYFFTHYFIYFIIFIYINLFLAQLLKFFIKTLIGYDLWTYIDDSFRFCQNNTIYDFETNNYILDYEYFDISEMIYYHNNFLVPKMLNEEQIYYYDLFRETVDLEDDDHELYGLMSTYIIPLQFQYYVLEHYWPEDEKISVLWENFYDFNDLEYEFKFIYENYKILWPKYKQYLHTRQLFYNEKLYDSKISQYYYYLSENYIFNKLPLSYIITLDSRKFFWKKEYRSFDLIEPPKELCLTNHMTWFLLKKEYDRAKFEYDVFCNLSPYDIFDSQYFDLILSPTNNLLDMQTKRSQYIENIDDYYFDFINSDNGINYYFDLNFLEDYTSERLEVFDMDYDKPYDPFDYLFCYFSDRAAVMINSLLIFIYCGYILFFLFVCYYCWFNHIYAYDFELHYNYIRMLTRHRIYNEYDDYKNLIFNYTKNDVDNIFFKKNIKLELEKK